MSPRISRLDLPGTGAHLHITPFPEKREIQQEGRSRARPGGAGVVAKGPLYLLIIGIVVFLGALTLAALRMRRRPGRHQTR